MALVVAVVKLAVVGVVLGLVRSKKLVVDAAVVV